MNEKTIQYSEDLMQDLHLLADGLLSASPVSGRACLSCQKGGDPAAPSGTATLLRLHPPRRTYLRNRPPFQVGLATSGTPDSDGVTGGVYKARERIHHAMLMRDY